jgi:cobalamin biosynthesis protein CobT
MLTHEIRETSKVLSRDHGIKVQIGGTEHNHAGTDGKTVMFPAVPLGVEYTPQEVSIMRGYVDHEAAHKRHTDFRTLRPGNKWFEAMEKYPLLPHMSNAIEDLRIEALASREYAGSQYNLRAVAENVAEKFLKNHAGTPAADQLAAVLPLAVTWAGRQAMGYNSPSMQAALDSLHPEIKEIAEKICSTFAARAPKNTSEVHQLAMDTLAHYGLDYTRDDAEIAQRAKDRELSKEGKKDSSGAGGGGAPGSEGEEASGNPGEGEGSTGTGNVDTKGTAGSASEKEDVESAMFGEETETKDTTSDGTDEDGWAGEANRGVGGGHDTLTKAMGRDAIANEGILDHSIDQAMNALAEAKFTEGANRGDWGKPNRQGKTVEHYTAPVEEYDSYVTLDMAKGRWGNEPKTATNKACAQKYKASIEEARTNNAYQRLKSTTAAATNRMRKNLEAALLSKKERVWRGGYEDGNLDPRSLSKAMTGATAIHKRRTEAEDFDTAVLIAVDASGSMCGKRAVTQQCLIALAEVFERIGIPFAVTTWNTDAIGYSGYGGDKEWRQVHKDYADPYYSGTGPQPTHTRLEPISVYELKGFDDTLKAAENSLAAYEHIVGGGNVDSDAILQSYLRLLAPRPEKRKVFIVLSDGATCDTEFHDESGKYGRMNFVTAELEKECELIGIGIMDSNVKKHYTNWVVTRSLEELAGACMKPINQMLLGGKVKSIHGGDRKKKKRAA